MFRKITALILTLLMIAVTVYIISQIKAYNLDYYSGKDDGVVVQLESVIIFSFLFYVLISKKNKILFGCLGLLSGVVFSVIAYLLLDASILFPFLASLLIVALFYFLEKLIGKKYGKEEASR